jgi:hypothetical protein
MPRCEICNRMQASGHVRKMPARDVYRCKEKFDCELAASNRDPYTAVIEVTYPAKHMREAWEIIDGLDKQLAPFPVSIARIKDNEGNATYSKKEAIAVTSNGPESLNELLRS